MTQDPAQGTQIAQLHEPVEHRVRCLFLVDEQVGTKDWSQRHGHQQGAADGKPRVGVGHRAE